MFAEKLAAQFYERFPETFKNALNFRVELKPLFLKSFQGSRTQFQSKILVMLRTDVYAGGQTLFEEIKRDTDVLKETFAL